jgi:hypothetical protein
MEQTNKTFFSAYARRPMGATERKVVMTRSLSPRPNLGQIKKQAKELLKAHGANDRSACQALRLLHRFQGSNDQEILAAAVTLRDTQLALALKHGFQDWPDLKAHVSPTEGTLPELRRDGTRVWIDGVLRTPVGSGRNRQLLGLRTLMRSRGVKAELDDLLVCGGNAFTFSHRDGWHETTRLSVPTDFMRNAAEAFGLDLQWHITPFHKTMPEYEPLTHAAVAEIRSYIDKGQPVLVGGVTEYGCGTWSVVVGYDTREPQLAHVGLGRGIRWMGIRGVAFPCNANPNDFLDKHWNAQVQMPRQGRMASTSWLVNPFVTLEAGQTVDSRDRIVKTLRLAEELSRFRPDPAGSSDKYKYWFGQDAFEHAACDYETLTVPEILGAEPREAVCRMQMLCDQVAWLRDDRRAAAAFCRMAAAENVLDAAMLTRAADGYDRVTRTIDQELHGLAEASFAEACAWCEVESNRAGAARALREAARHEQQAISAIERALDSQEA